MQNVFEYNGCKKPFWNFTRILWIRETMCKTRTSLTSSTQTMWSCASMTRYLVHSPHSHLPLYAFTGITLVAVYSDRFTAARTAGSSIWKTRWCATEAETTCSLRQSERQSGDYFSVWFQGLKNQAPITTRVHLLFSFFFCLSCIAKRIYCLYLFIYLFLVIEEYSLLLDVFFISRCICLHNYDAEWKILLFSTKAHKICYKTN